MIISASFVSDSQKKRLDNFSKGLKGLGADYVSHVIHGPDGVWTGYASHPEWAERYIQQEMFRLEPITKLMDQSTRSVLAWEFVPETSDKGGIFKARAEACHIVKGVTIATSYQGYKEFLALGFASEQAELSDFLLEYSDLIKNYIQMFRNEHTLKRIADK